MIYLTLFKSYRNESFVIIKCSMQWSSHLLNSTFSRFRSRGYKTFSCSTQLSIKFSLLINMKMPTIVYKQRNFHAQLFLTRKNLQLLIIWDLLAGQKQGRQTVGQSFPDSVAIPLEEYLIIVPYSLHITYYVILNRSTLLSNKKDISEL